MGWFDDYGPGADMDAMDAALERFGKSRAAFYDAGSQRFEKGTRKCSACCAYKNSKDFTKEEAARPAARRLCKSCAQSAPPKPAPKRKSAAPAAKKAPAKKPRKSYPTEEEYHVAKILDRREKPKGKIQYLVKWTGWDDPTWEPSAFVEDTEALDVYLEERQAAAAWDPRTESPPNAPSKPVAKPPRPVAAKPKPRPKAPAKPKAPAAAAALPTAIAIPIEAVRAAVASAPVAAAPTTSAPVASAPAASAALVVAEAVSDQSVTAEAVAIELVASERKPPPQVDPPATATAPRTLGRMGCRGGCEHGQPAKACAFGCCGMCCAKMRGMQRCARHQKSDGAPAQRYAVKAPAAVVEALRGRPDEAAVEALRSDLRSDPYTF